MSYSIPQDYKCPKCGHETKFGPHDHWDKSPVMESGNPVCPKCWNAFLTSFGSEMLTTVPWTAEGDAYTNKLRSLALAGKEAKIDVAAVKERLKTAEEERTVNFRQSATPWFDYSYNV